MHNKFLSMKKRQVDNSLMLRRYLAVMIAVSLLWAGLLLFNYYKEGLFRLDSLIAEEQAGNRATAKIMSLYLEGLKADLLVVRDSDEMREYLNDPSEKNRKGIEALFIRLMTNKTEYYQLRFIDISGSEFIRVERDEEGRPITGELQYKGDRDYFNEALPLPKGELYISPLDLNIENGEIEVPHKPVIRIASPLFDGKQNRRGIVVLNHKADRFLDLMEERKYLPSSDHVTYYITDGAGRFIDHPDDDLDFSYMKKGSENASIFQTYPRLDESLFNKGEGIITEGRDTLIFFDYLSEAVKALPGYGEKWVVLYAVDNREYIGLSRLLERLNRLPNLFVFILINLFSLLYAYLIESLINRNYELKMAWKIAESTEDAVIITDWDTRILHVNRAFEKATGYKEEEILGHRPNEFKSGRQSEKFYRDMWSDINSKGEWEGTLWDKKKDGMLYPKKLKILSICRRKSKGKGHYIGIFSVLTEKEQKIRTVYGEGDDRFDLKWENEEMLIRLLDSSIKDKSFRFMVLCVVIENFNQLLSLAEEYDADTISAIFHRQVKSLVHEDDFIAQTGRNMYTVIVNLNHIEGSHEDFIDNVYTGLSRIIRQDTCEILFKARMGVSFWPNDAEDVGKLLLNSLIALEWTLKRQNREYAFFAPEMLEVIGEENRIERSLQKALANGELHLVYHPQVDAVTGETVGAEALIRWNSPEIGPVPPGKFIPVAEKSSLMIDIGYWILEEVCRDIKTLQKSKIPSGFPLKIAVNISAMQLEAPSFAERALALIDSYSVDRKFLEFEITEGILLSNQEKNNKIMNRFRSKGIAIALDDFGTGYSSLSYLHKLPVDKIKIDRSFIKDYPEADDGKMAEILVDMAESLGMNVLTEGVETEEQLRFIRQTGCRIIQGYYFSKPLPFGEFEDFLSRDSS